MRRRRPKYRRHSTGQAFVEVGKKRHYLGKFDSPESRQRYYRLLAELEAQPDEPPASLDQAESSITVNELLVVYWQHAEQYYPSTNPQSNTLNNIRNAIKRLSELHGDLPAAEFDPQAMETIRARMIAQNLSRRYINDTTARIRAVFKWAAGKVLVPVTTWQTLCAIEPLKRGRSAARETAPVAPVDPADVAVVLPFVSPPVVALIRLQELTGMRSDNLTALRECDIDATGEIWLYRPPRHKSQHRGRELVVPLGPKAQAIIGEFLGRDRRPDDYLFSPIESKAWYQAQKRSKRKSKVQPSQVNRKKRKPKRAPGRRYTTASYREAVKSAIAKARKAGVTVNDWFPHQLRHTLSTEVRRRYDLEAAQVLLGHARVDTTEIYAERNLEKAIEVARQIG